MRAYIVTITVLAGAAVLAACTNSGFGPSATTPGANSISRAHKGRSWLDASAKTSSLVYVSDQYAKQVLIFSYPKLKLVGTLTGFSQPDGECTDATGDVWVTDYLASQIVEYAHGSTTVKATLSDPNNFPYACAVDPTSGDLAVVNLAHNPVPGSISIYAGAKGYPKVYTDNSMSLPFFDAYDSKGNLFVDGIRGFYYPGFAMTSFRHGTFTNIELNQTINSPGDIVVVGARVNVGDSFRYTQAVYGFSIKGQKGRLLGVTHLDGTNVVEEFDIRGNALIAANIDQTVGSGMVFRYPNGGRPKRVFGRGKLTGPIGLVVSP